MAVTVYSKQRKEVSPKLGSTFLDHLSSESRSFRSFSEAVLNDFISFNYKLN